jgi:hypothetical protein
MGFFSKFTKKKASVAQLLISAHIGDAVYIKFIDPRQMGYLNLDDAFSRFDSEDIETKTCLGQITRVRHDPTLDMHILDILSVKTSGRQRNQMFLESEIVDIEFFKRNKS